MILTPEEKTVLSESSEDTLTVIYNTELAVIAKMHAGCTYCTSSLYAGITCPCCGRHSEKSHDN